MTIISIVIGALGTVTKRISASSGEVGNNGTSKDCPNYSIVEIGQNTEKSPGVMRKLADTQTPTENHQLTLM